MQGVGYLVIADRFSGWPHIVASLSGAEDFARALIIYFSTHACLSNSVRTVAQSSAPMRLPPCWNAGASDTTYPPSPTRPRTAEVAVKSMKRLLTLKMTKNGDISNEAAVAGLVQYRNTPDPQSGISLAEVVFGRPI